MRTCYDSKSVKNKFLGGIKNLTANLLFECFWSTLYNVTKKPIKFEHEIFLLKSYSIVTAAITIISR